NDSFSYVNFGGNVVYFQIGWNWHDASFLFPTHGTYPICLHIKDSLSNCIDSICKTITVYGCYTSIDTTSSDSIYTFKASSWGGTAPYSYSWTIFDSTSNTTLYSGSMDSVSVIILFGHNCYAYLTSTDSTGCTSYAYHEVYNYWVPQLATCYNSISFINNDSLYYFMAVPWGGTPPYTYNWLIMDSTTNTFLCSGYSATVNSILTQGHNYSVDLTTIDSVGCTYSSNASVVGNWQQNNLPCNAVFVLLPDSVNTHLYQGYNYSTGSNLSYNWSWGDGSTDTMPYPNHTYASAGFYNVCLTVWNNNCSDSQCVYYNVNRMNAKNAMHSINIINTQVPNGIKNINNEKPFSVYPNPAKDELNFNLNDEKVNSIKITSIDGKLNFQTTSALNEININNLSTGIYFVEVQTNNNIFRTKFLKE
ncbi:MAG: hypothetical protein RL065_951, partial [Bacteroidota bacterium]